MEQICEVMKKAAPSASRSLHLVYSEPKSLLEYGYIPFEFDFGLVSDDLENMSRGFFSEQLTHYFSAPSKKTSSLEQRFRNAVHLLAEADVQESDAIALSLCFSAIEAMVCEKTDGIVEELARNVVSLLEPDALERPAAIQETKRLYNLRSKTLHGAVIEGDEPIRWKARALAAAVVYAVSEWRKHISRVGHDASRADFMSELRALSSTGKKMVGVPETLNRFIPR